MYVVVGGFMGGYRPRFSYQAFRLLWALLFLIAAAGAQADAPQMQLPGSFSVAPSGQATYAVPISVPPGTAGMTPALSLAYSSGGGDGLLGMGWSLMGLPSVTRCARTIAQDGTAFSTTVTFTKRDDFCYGGRKLVAVNGGTYGHDATEYRTEVESFTRIVSHGAYAYPDGSVGPIYFEVWTKTGEHMYFGNTTDSTIMTVGLPSNVPASWALNQITDLSGNYLNVKYATQDTATGETHPIEIDYTGNSSSGQSPYNKVVFGYSTPRPDPIKTWQSGSSDATKVLLTDITTWNGISSPTLVSDYRLAYGTSGTNRSILQSITLCSSSGSCQSPTFSGGTFSPPACVGAGTCLPPTEFTYTPDGTINATNGNVGNWNSTLSGNSYFIGDFDGIGASSVLWVQSVSTGGTGAPSWPVTMWLNNGQGTFTKVTANLQLPVNTPDGSTCSFYRGYVGDFNGDGKADIYWDCVIENGNGYLWLSNGNGNFTQISESLIPSGSFSWNAYVADLNGDGRADLLFNLTSGTSGSSYYSAISTGGGAFTVVKQSSPTIAGTTTCFCNIEIADFNADGRADVFAPLFAGGAPYIFQGNGDGTFTNMPISASGDSVSGWTAYLGNFGWDENAGILWRNGTAAKLWLGHGNGSFTVIPTLGTVSGNPHLGDFEGTGRTDIYWDVENAQGVSSSTSRTLWLNNGNGTFQNYGDVSTVSSNGYAPVIGDFNGDGKADILWDSETTAGITTGSRQLWTSIRNNADAIKTITSGLGATSTLTYDYLTDSATYTKGSGAVYPTIDLQMPFPVVSQVAADTGLGNGSTYVTSYSYQRAKLELDGRGFLGFTSRTTSGPPNGAVPHIYVQTDGYATAWPQTGLLNSTTKTHPPNVNPLVSQSNTYATIAPPQSGTLSLGQVDTGYKDVHLTDSSESGYDLDDSSFMGTTTSHYVYDSFDNPTLIDIKVQDPIPSPWFAALYETKTSSEYWNVTSGSSWIIGRMACSQIVSTAPGSLSATRTTDVTYNSNWLVAKQFVEPNATDASTAVPTGGTASGCTGAGGTVRLETDLLYDAYGNTTSVTAIASDSVSANRQTTAIYGDGENRFPTSATNALGQTSTYSYNSSFGEVTLATDPNNLSNTRTYDGFGRITSDTPADQTYTKWTYLPCPSIGGSYSCPVAPNWQELVVVDSLGTDHSTVIAPQDQGTYDQLGRQVYKATAAFQTSYYSRTAYTYDQWFRLLEETTPYLDNASSITDIYYYYDDKNRPTYIVYPDNSGVQYTYAGLKTTQTKTNGGSTTITEPHRNGAPFMYYDTLNNTTTVTVGAFGEALSVADAAGTTSYAYDVLGNLTQVTDPDSGTRSATYSSFNQPLTVTTPNETAQGWPGTGMTYDKLGRLTQRTEPDLIANWTYDAGAGGSGVCIGVLATATTAAGAHGNVSPPGGYSRAQTYDSYCRPKGTAITLGGTAYGAMQTNYDALGRYAGTTYPDGYQTTATYTNQGYTQSVESKFSSGGSVQALYTVGNRDALGNATSATTGNGLTDTRTFDTVGRPNSVSVAGSSSTFVNQQYTWDYMSRNNLLKRVDLVNNLTENFCYDKLDDLGIISWAGGTSGTTSMAYSPATTPAASCSDLTNTSPDGKYRLTYKSDVGTYSYGSAAHRAQSISGSVVSGSFTYDADGNTLTDPPATGWAGRTMTWTSFDMPATVKVGTTITTTMYYDPEHRKVQMATSPTTATNEPSVKYLTDGRQMAERVMWQGGAESERNYVYGPDGEIGTYWNQFWWSHHDWQNSNLSQTNLTGGSAYSMAYDAWGKRRSITGSAFPINGGTNSGASDHAYIGQEELDGIALTNLNARNYDPYLARFISSDPIGRQGGPNPYAYAGNNPTTRSDPAGLSECVGPCDGFTIPDINGTLDEVTVNGKPDGFPAPVCVGGCNLYLGGDISIAGAYGSMGGNYGAFLRDFNNFKNSSNQAMQFHFIASTNADGSVTLKYIGATVGAPGVSGGIIMPTDSNMLLSVQSFSLSPETSGPSAGAAGTTVTGGADIDWFTRATAPVYGQYTQQPSAVLMAFMSTSAEWTGEAFLGGFVGKVAVSAGRYALNAIRGWRAAEKAAPALTKGGTYVLRNLAGDVMRVGRTNDLVRREAEHALDPILKDFRFDPIHRTDSYAEQRGLEQMLHDVYDPPLDKINPISPRNSNYDSYMGAANQYLDRTGE